MGKKYYYEIDLVRTIVMFFVLSVHTLTVFNHLLLPDSFSYLTVASIHSLLHGSRMAFMFITGFVLFIVYQKKSIHLWSFWKKRFSLMLVPYFFWNFIYMFIENSDKFFGKGIFTFCKIYFSALFQGNLGYIYYMIIVFQFYLIFPFLHWFLKKFEKYQIQILVVSIICQILQTLFIKFALPTMDRSNWPYLLNHYGLFLLTYQGYFISGGIIAANYEKIRTWLLKNGQKVIRTFLLSLPIMVGNYFFNRFILNESNKKAQIIHQPMYVIYSFLIIALLFYLGLKWDQLKTAQPDLKVNHWISLAAKLSFGMYLIQPIPLSLLKNFILPHLTVNGSTVFFYMPLGVLFVYLVSFGIAVLFYVSPYLSYCIGRGIKKWRK